MKIGILVDGVAEFTALPNLLPKISTSHTVLKPIKADIQPLAPVGHISRTLQKGLKILSYKRIHKAIVLLDHENRESCPGVWAREIEKSLTPTCATLQMECAVVVKYRCFENWLVADLDALGQMPRRFILSNGDQSQVSPNRSDSCDGQALLEKMVRFGSYDKVADAAKILTRADPNRIAQNSRSFRRFLRVLDVPGFSAQSRTPV